MKKLFLVSLPLAALILAGCGTLKLLDRSAYDIGTNHVPVISLHTNALGQVVPVTNWFDVTYPVATEQGKINARETWGAIGSLLGIGGIIGTLAAGAYMGYAKYREGRAMKTLTTAQQIIQVGREVIASGLGSAVEAKYKDYMVNAQEKAGVKDVAEQVRKENVDDNAAEAHAMKIMSPPTATVPSQPRPR